MRARASAEIASSEPPEDALRRMFEVELVPDDRRTFVEREAGRLGRPGLVWRSERVERAARSEDDDDLPDAARLDPVPSAAAGSRLGGSTIGATGRSSMIERRMAAGRGVVAARYAIRGDAPDDEPDDDDERDDERDDDGDVDGDDVGDDDPPSGRLVAAPAVEANRVFATAFVTPFVTALAIGLVVRAAIDRATRSPTESAGAPGVPED
jgi:hypothetical protein